MATPQEKAFRMIFPEATNQPQQPQQTPWWAAGNTISGRGAQPTGRRRNVFYDAQTGAPTSNPGQPIGGSNEVNDLALIREIMQPRSSVVTNDPSGWLNGGASREFQEFFKKTPEKDAAYARRKQELDAGSMANVNPAISRNAVDVAKKNQEAMNMIFPKQPAGDPMATRSDMVKTALPGGGFTASLDGRYGTGSSTVRPRPRITAQTEIDGKKLAEPILFNNAPKAAQAAPPTQSSMDSGFNQSFDMMMGPPAPLAGPPNPIAGPPNYGEVLGPFPEQAGPADWMNQSAWDYTPLPQEEAENIRYIAGRGNGLSARLMQVFNPFTIIPTLAQGGQSALPAMFGNQPTYPNANDRLAGDTATIKSLGDRGLLKTNRAKDKYGEDIIQVMRPSYNGFPIPF